MNYGKFWQEAGLDFYKWTHEGRKAQHEYFLAWVDDILPPGGSVLEIGCGYGVFYPEYFKGRGVSYTGVDIASRAIDYCRDNVPGVFYKADVTAWHGSQADLVFSQGVIDNTPDMDEFIKAHARLSRDWVYIATCRGYFPDIRDHAYRYNAEQEVWYNDLSVRAANQTLIEAGFSLRLVMNVKRETVIVARK